LAADSGADHLARLGLRPELVIGDLDSLRPTTRNWLGESVMLFLPDQERTDLDKALEHAFGALGVERLIVLAATGGRVDHEIANLGLLARFALGERLVFETGQERVLALTGEGILEAQPGEVWSFWTFDPAVRVSIEGVHWPLENEVMPAGTTRWISNQAVADRVSVTATGGAVVIMRQRIREQLPG
jgi:thiamine pyrophosphokinase